MADVLIMLGSKSDLAYGEKCRDTLDQLEISNQLEISSAHRQPQKTSKLATEAGQNGVKVIICMAGMAAHLPGVVASQTDLPVLGVPLSGSPLKGLDSLYSIVQMPKGVPVGTLALDNAGAVNSALFAARIIALSRPEVYNKLNEYREKLASK